jgi:hypothetical protein
LRSGVARSEARSTRFADRCIPAMGEGTTTTRTKRTSKMIGRPGHGTPYVVVSAHGCRMPLAILLAATLVTLLPLVSSDPSDPTWLVGIYDEADGDSISWQIERTELTTHPKSVNEGRRDSGVPRPLRVIAILRYFSDSAPAFISLLASPARAPPFVWLDGVLSPRAFHLVGARKSLPLGRHPVQLTRSTGRHIHVDPSFRTGGLAPSRRL